MAFSNDEIFAFSSEVCGGNRLKIIMLIISINNLKINIKN